MRRGSASLPAYATAKASVSWMKTARRPEHTLDDVCAVDPRGLGGEVQYDAMAQCRERDAIDVGVHDVRSAVEEGHDFGSEEQRLPATRARAVCDVTGDVVLAGDTAASA